MSADMKNPAGSAAPETTILIVDDDRNNLAIMADYLEGLNYTILVAEDGETGIERAVYARPDLILLDVMMPGIDGYETCRRLKVTEATRDIPVIFMTALAETEHKVKGLAAGAVDYVTKPFQREEVLARIDVHLRLRELAIKLQEANESLERRVEERTIELRNSERRLADIIHFLPDALFAINPAGEIILWNQTAEELTGAKTEEMLGKGDHEYSLPLYGIRRPTLVDLVLNPSAEIEKLYPYITRVDHTVISEGYSTSMKHGEIYILGIAAPLYDSAGAIVGAIESIRDITARKNAEAALHESERKFRAIFDQTFQFIGLLLLDGTLIEINKAALMFSGVEEPEVIGRPFWETPWWAHSEELQTKLRDAVSRAAQGEFVRFEATHPAADGRLHYVDFSLKPVKDEAGNVILLIPEGRDITERKEIERLKDEMVSAVSHEMRTPLTAMLGFTDLLLEEQNVEPQQQKEYLTIIRNETERLSGLIGNFLDLQRLKARGEVFTWQPVSVQAILEEAAGHFSLLSQRHYITVDCPSDLPQVRGSAKFLRQAIDNIVANAIKYSPDGGEVYLGAHREQSSVVIMVRDEGIGIPPEAQEKIFETFFRVDNTDRRATGGTGLGLALVREIIAIHRGSIWVESTLGRGSTFYIKLPLNTEAGLKVSLRENRK